MRDISSVLALAFIVIFLSLFVPINDIWCNYLFSEGRDWGMIGHYLLASPNTIDLGRDTPPPLEQTKAICKVWPKLIIWKVFSISSDLTLSIYQNGQNGMNDWNFSLVPRTHQFNSNVYLVYTLYVSFHRPRERERGCVTVTAGDETVETVMVMKTQWLHSLISDIGVW